jgi:hypothetical protein
MNPGRRSLFQPATTAYAGKAVVLSAVVGTFMQLLISADTYSEETTYRHGGGEYSWT